MGINIFTTYLMIAFLTMASLISGCGIKVTTKGKVVTILSDGDILSGEVTPFLGLIAQNHQNSIPILIKYFLPKSALSSPCAEPVIVKLFQIKDDGTIDEDQVLASMTLDSRAKYEFNMKSLNLSHSKSEVQYVVRAEGCNGEFYKRPVTMIDKNQNIDSNTNVISEVINAHTLVTRTLNQVSRIEVDAMIKSLNGNSLSSSLTSLKNTLSNANRFKALFGDTPQNVISNSRPEAKVQIPALILNELQVYQFQVKTFHVDPTYDFAYRWKVDGVLKNSSSIFHYIPEANASGLREIEVFVGKNSAGVLDTSKPFFYKKILVSVNNTILPTAPTLSIHASTPSPTPLSQISLSINTGVSSSECQSFHSMAITLDPTPPGPMAFVIECTQAVTQLYSLDLTGMTDGAKTAYLWAKDLDGNISSPESVNFVLDTTAPSLTLNSFPTHYRGGGTYNLSVAMTDTTTQVSHGTVEISSNDGVSYVSHGSFTGNVNQIDFLPPAMTNSAAYKLRVKIWDLAGNQHSEETSSLTIDSIAPSAPTLSRTSAAISSSQNVDLTINCLDDSTQMIFKESSSVPLLNDAGWENCANSKTFQVTNSDGVKSIYAFTRDLAGNISSASSVTMTLDKTLPTLTLTNFNSGKYKGGNTYTILYSMNDVNPESMPITIDYTLDGVNYVNLVTNVSNSGSRSITLPTSTDVNTFKIKISAIDLAGNVKTVSSSTSMIIDSTAPVGSTISVHGNPTLSEIQNIQLLFSGTDNLSNITHFCIRMNDNTPPTSNSDPCWISLANIGEVLSPNFSLDHYPWTLGTAQGVYTFYSWYKDEHGHLSTNTNSLGVDRHEITFSPDSVPVISNFTASSNNTPSSPFLLSDTTVPMGNDLYIKWNIVDNQSIPNGSIQLYYTTDDVNYVLISGGLDNAEGSGCTINVGVTTGCYKWSMGSPTNNFYRIKLVVTDQGGQVVYEISNPVNTGNVKFLSGNTSLGIGGSAKNAIFRTQNEIGYNDFADNQGIEVGKAGIVFFRLYTRGIVYIDPNDGLLKDLIRATGTTPTGDGGSVFSATLYDAKKITMDYDDNLIIADNDRIRKVDLSTNPWTITRLAGGGADTSDGANALSASIGSFSHFQRPITVMPNGRIYFEKNRELWFYDPTTAKVHLHLLLTGIGTSIMTGYRATYDNGICGYKNAVFSFNKSTNEITKIIRLAETSSNAICGGTASITAIHNTNFNVSTGLAEAPHPPDTNYSATKFTGLDGNIYNLVHGRSVLTRYNSVTNAWDVVLGTSGTIGRCEDGTMATSCNVTVLSAFVSEFGKIYFVDMGVIRTIDNNGKVQTIAGQPRNFGVGFNPISSRYSLINFFDYYNDQIYIKNELENIIVKFSLNGGVLEKIAGNSQVAASVNNAVASTSPIPSCSWAVPCGIKIDPVNNRLYHHGVMGGLTYIDLGTGLWVNQGNIGSVLDSGSRIIYNGRDDNGNLLAYVTSHYGSSGDKANFREINPTLNTNTLVYSTNSVVAGASQMSTICTTGIVGTSCTLPYSHDASKLTTQYFLGSQNSWILAIKNQKTLGIMPAGGGTVNLYETLNKNL